jgi:hypothetical protein
MSQLRFSSFGILAGNSTLLRTTTSENTLAGPDGLDTVTPYTG